MIVNVYEFNDGQLIDFKQVEGNIIDMLPVGVEIDCKKFKNHIEFGYDVNESYVETYRLLSTEQDVRVEDLNFRHPIYQIFDNL